MENPAPRQKILKSSIETTNMLFRPNKSAILPKNKSSEPAVRLCTNQSFPTFYMESRQTHLVAAFIQVISAFVIPNSLPAKLLMTVIAPDKKLVIATAIVTENTNKHSCSVDLKHSGRALGSRSLIGGEGLPSSASFSGWTAMDGKVVQTVIAKSAGNERVKDAALLNSGEDLISLRRSS